MDRRRLWIGTVLSAVIGIIGCDGDRPTTIPVTGRVTINGEAPGESGRLYFTPTHTAEGYPNRPASANFLADGVYRVMSWVPEDGLVPGHYRVSVAPGDANKTNIPEKYNRAETSGLEVEVPITERRIEFNVDLVKD